MGASYRFDENGRELLPVSKTVSQVNEYIKLLISTVKSFADKLFKAHGFS